MLALPTDRKESQPSYLTCVQMPNSVRWMALVCGSLLIGVGCTHFGVMYGIWWPTWGVVASCALMLVMGEDILAEVSLPTRWFFRP
jgi:hypothetical protein